MKNYHFYSFLSGALNSHNIISVLFCSDNFCSYISMSVIFQMGTIFDSLFASFQQGLTSKVEKWSQKNNFLS